MNPQNKLIPPFLKKLDQHLLLNNRLLWQTKIHFVLFYGVLAVVGAMAFTWLYPLGTDKALPDEEYIAGFMTAPALILLCYWVYTQYQYSIEADFGEIKPAFAQYRLMIYTLVALIFSAPILITAFGLHQRKANIISLEELEVDDEELHLGRFYFTTDSSEADFYPIFKNDSFNCQLYTDATLKLMNSQMEIPYSLELPTCEELREEWDEVKALEIYNKDKTLIKIENYLSVARKYGIDVPENLQPDLIWRKFKKDEFLLNSKTYRIFKSNLYERSYDLKKTHSPLINESNVYPFWLCVLSGFVLFGALIQLLVIARLKRFIFSAVSFILLAVMAGVYAELVKDLIGISIARYIVFTSVFVLFLITSYQGFVRRQSLFTHISLGASHIFAPFALIWVIAGLGVNIMPLEGSGLLSIIEVRDLDLQNAIYLLLSVLFYTAFLSRLFYKKHIRLNALPT